jgi:hypothetical protein
VIWTSLSNESTTNDASINETSTPSAKKKYWRSWCTTISISESSTSNNANDVYDASDASDANDAWCS